VGILHFGSFVFNKWSGRKDPLIGRLFFCKNKTESKACHRNLKNCIVLYVEDEVWF